MKKEKIKFIPLHSVINLENLLFQPKNNEKEDKQILPKESNN